jgi:hypothetical protein
VLELLFLAYVNLTGSCPKVVLICYTNGHGLPNI